MSHTKRNDSPAISLFAGVVTLIALAVGVAACGSDDGGSDGDSGSDEPIKVGMVLSLSGPIGPYDQGVEWGAERAAEEINADGGVDGRQIETVVADNKSDAAVAANSTAKVIEEEGAEVLISPCVYDLGGSTSSLEASQSGVLSISGCATAPVAPDASGGLHFDILPSAFSEGAAMAEYAMEQGYEHPVSVEDTTSSYFKQVTEAFDTRYEQLGGEVVDHLTMEYEAQSFAPQVSEISQASPTPDVIYLGTYMPAATKFLREVRAAGLDTPVLGTEDWDGETWKSDADVSDVTFAAVASMYGDDPTKEINDLVADFESDTGEELGTTVGLVGGYRAMEAIAKAIEESDGSTDGADLTATMEGWEDVDLLGGAVTFTPELHVPLAGDERLMEIQNNETSLLEVKRAEEVPLPDE